MSGSTAAPRSPVVVGFQVEWLTMKELFDFERSHLDTVKRTLRHRREWATGTAEHGILSREARYHLHRCHVLRRKQRELMAETMRMARENGVAS